jgi:hypothetical protein
MSEEREKRRYIVVEWIEEISPHPATFEEYTYIIHKLCGIKGLVNSTRVMTTHQSFDQMSESQIIGYEKQINPTSIVYYKGEQQ